ncbi:MAG TPA: ABC transporter permease [Terriglobales bacterium]|nr:ABC transporter permease [Terriglobales bacterium]
MQIESMLRDALRVLARNKMRSSLTVLGIMIGIGAVICVVAIGTAGSAQVEEQLHNLGDNLVWIEAGSRTRSGVHLGSHQTKTLTVGDANALLQQVRLIKSVSPQVDGSVQIVYGNQNWSTIYRGEGADYFDIKRWTVRSGVPFTEEDVRRSADVCVLGETVRQQLFGGEEPLGKVIRVGDVPCKVIGTLAPKGQSWFGQDQDDTILMPYTTVQKKIAGITWLKDIMCSAVTPQAVKQATQQAVILLRERHHIKPGEDDDFNIRSPEDVIQAQLAASKVLTALLVSIASVALLVGGIGIMNVMLVSVTERTREIGVRMAVGATEGNIQFHFLIEALLLSLLGGAMGVLLGAAGSVGITRVLGWPVELSPQAVAVASLFSAAVGVFFGYYPARKAARMDPIEALRYE